MMGNTGKQIKQMCTTCMKSEHTKSRAKGNSIGASETVTIYVDECSPMLMKSIGGSSYFLTMTPSKHRFKRVKIMKSRAEVAAYGMDFIAWLDRNSKKRQNYTRITQEKFFT